MSEQGGGRPPDPTGPTTPPTGPTGTPGVAPPRFGDSTSQAFTPDYSDRPPPPTPPPPPPGPPAEPPASPPAGPVTPGSWGSPGPDPRRDPWWQFAAPIAAGVVVVAGVAFLVVRGGGEDTVETGSPTTDEPVRADDPEDPVVETTMPPDESTAPPVPSTPVTSPRVTSPPLIDTDVTVETVASSTVPATGNPTQAELDAALLTASDLGGGWSEVEFFDGDVCTADSFDDQEVAEAVVVYEQDPTDEGAVRQITQIVTSYTDVDASANAFSAELAAIEACNATTVDVDGVGYDVRAVSDSFDDDALALFSCRDDSASVIVEFTDPDGLVPYIGQALIAFRCGVNVVGVSYASTVDLADLSNATFITGAGRANADTALLTGS